MYVTHKRQQKPPRLNEYGLVYPDLCIFVSDYFNKVHPSIIVETGFSHPMSIVRAHDYINPIPVRLSRGLVESTARIYRLQLRRDHGLEPPPYGIVRNLFRCNIESVGEYDT